MDQAINDYISYLHNVKKASLNTEQSYHRDLKKLAVYLSEKGISDIKDVTDRVLRDYIEELTNQGAKASTVSRSIASVKAFFHYMHSQDKVSRDPSLLLKAP